MRQRGTYLNGSNERGICEKRLANLGSHSAAMCIVSVYLAEETKLIGKTRTIGGLERHMEIRPVARSFKIP